MKTRRIRTILNEDQQFSSSELDLLHTPSLQRLYDLHQLGLTDRVFIDASHCRLQHVVGVVYEVDRLITAVACNLRAGADRQPLAFGPDGKTEFLTPAELADLTESRRQVARLMALLHDLTHAPFGHTLEDEIGVVSSKHDDPERQASAFLRLVCEYLGWLVRDHAAQTSPPDRSISATAHAQLAVGLRPARTLQEYLDCSELLAPPSDVNAVATEFCRTFTNANGAPPDADARTAKEAVHLLGSLDFAMTALLHLELLHKKRPSPVHLPHPEPYPFQQLIRSVLKELKQSSEPPQWFVPHRDAYLLDLIGNTICADLLDYARRDAFQTNLKINYDSSRIVENITLVSAAFPSRDIEGRSDPFNGTTLRTAISLFSHKLRVDVPGQLMNLLQARFDVFQRALFHPTKCIAGAMLGRAIQLLGWRTIPDHLANVGDQVFLHLVRDAAAAASEVIRECQSPGSTGVDRLRFEARLAAIKQLPRSGFTMTLLSVIEAQLDPPNTPLDASLRPGAMENLDAASGLLRRLGARRYHRTVFRLLPISDESHVSMLARSEDVEQSKSLPAIVAELFGNAKSRFDLECSIEDGIGAPRGSVVVHCPPYKGPVKLAEILLLEVRKDGRDQTRSLSRIGELLNGLFLEHEKAVTALHGMYSSMWRLTVSVTAPLHLKHATLSPIIAKSIRDHLVKIHCRYRESLLTIENDPSMERELDVAARRRKPVEPTREAADSPGRSASASSDTRRELDASVQTIAAPHPGRATRSLDGLPTASELELFRSRLSTLFDRYNFGFGERDRISLLKSLQSRAAAMSSGELQLASAELELLCPKDRLVAARLKPKDVESAILAVLLRDRQS